MTFNARSLRNKTVGVIEFLNEHDCDLCFISESWLKLTDTSVISEIKDFGYDIKFQPRKGKRGGGVCVVYKSLFDVKKCKTKSYKSFELLEVTVKSATDLIRVSTFYRTGKMSVQERSTFINDFDDYLQCLVDKKGEKILCGDFNIHVENDSDIERNALYFTAQSYGFNQIINQATHRNGGTLDLIFIQQTSKYATSVIDSVYVYDLCCSLTSDHNFIEFSVPFNFVTTVPTFIQISYRDFKNVNVTEYCHDVIENISNACDDFFNEGADSAASIFHRCQQLAIEKHAPLINASIKPKRTQFSNREIVELRRKRRKAEDRWRKYKRSEDEAVYKSLVAETKKAVRNSRNKHYHNKFERCHGNKKETYKVIDKLIGNDKTNHLPAYENPTDLCNEFEQYFSDKITKIRNHTAADPGYLSSDTSHDEILNECISFSNFKELTDADVEKIIRDLPNKHCSLDPVPSNLFKQCMICLLPYVKHVLNSSLLNGVFPNCYKQALIKPKLKGQSLDKDILSNYRPLSNLSFMSKALERCVMNQLVSYLESNDMFSTFQSAYRKFHSCETAITKISNDIHCFLDNKQFSLLLFLDLSAAFDTVDHETLFSTLENKFGICSIAMKWFKSYLTSRQCKVNIGQYFSNGIFLLFGVPQGSILGPILFILYISGIEAIAKKYNLRIHIYADDTQLYIAFERCHLSAVIANVEHCLRELKSWMSSNYLKLNEDKTKFMVLSNDESFHKVYSDLCISFSGNIITPSLDAVNLGVLFDSKMSMHSYINNIVSRGYFKLSNLWKTADKLTLDLKVQLVTAYILPMIDYCNITFTAATKGYVAKLQKLLNSAVRFVFNLSGKNYRKNITPYMKKLHILPVEFRIKYKLSLTVYKCIHDLAPVYLKELLKPKISYAHLRSSNDLYALETYKVNGNSGQSSFACTAPLVWNALPIEVKLAANLEAFKKKLKSHYFVSYYGDD